MRYLIISLLLMGCTNEPEKKAETIKPSVGECYARNIEEYIGYHIKRGSKLYIITDTLEYGYKYKKYELSGKFLGNEYVTYEKTYPDVYRVDCSWVHEKITDNKKNDKCKVD